MSCRDIFKKTRYKIFSNIFWLTISSSHFQSKINKIYTEGILEINFFFLTISSSHFQIKINKIYTEGILEKTVKITIVTDKTVTVMALKFVGCNICRWLFN